MLLAVQWPNAMSFCLPDSDSRCGTCIYNARMYIQSEMINVSAIIHLALFLAGKILRISHLCLDCINMINLVFRP